MALDEARIYLSNHKLESLKPTGRRVMVEVFDDRGEVNGIAVPITDDNPFIPFKGVIFKVADDVDGLVRGDCVIIEQYKGKRVFVGKRQFILMSVEHVLAKIVED